VFISKSWLGGFLHRTLVNCQGNSERIVALDLNPHHEQGLQKLHADEKLFFYGTLFDHWEALIDLWCADFPPHELICLILK
jgi:hypothetical protein